MHVTPWCTYAHIESESFISHQTILFFFCFNPPTPVINNWVFPFGGRVEMKKDDVRPIFNVCICAPRCNVHQMYSRQTMSMAFLQPII
jgi:hypothetical protein